jgi:Tetratricopeptide repeat
MMMLKYFLTICFFPSSGREKRGLEGLPSMRRVLVVAILALSGSMLFAQVSEDRTRDWILYEKANAMIAQHEYGLALELYKEAISAAGIFPEAEIGIGDVLFEEGEFRLARDQYEKAYNLRNAFRVSSMQYDVLYKLADLFENQQMYKKMEDTLLKVVSDDKRFSAPESARLKDQIERNYLEKGIDRVLFLYQFNVPFATEAHSRLGWFYYRSGRYTQAVQQLLYALVYRAEEINAALHDTDVDYQFTTLAGMLEAVDASKRLSSYLADSNFFKDLYYLAGSSYVAGYPTHAVQVWKLIAASKMSGRYAALAARQLKKPWTESLLTVGTKGGSQ